MSNIFKYTVLWIVIWLKLKHCCGFADYRKVVRSKFFVDKTMMIKEICQDTYIKVVTAPKYFGKSTNLDMLRRFLELSVDKKGDPVDKLETADRKMFCSGKKTSKDVRCDICKEEKFFSDNFASRPVMAIDCTYIHGAVGYKNVTSMLKKVVKDTFKRHSYLMNIKSLWSEEFRVEDFKNYIVRNENLTRTELERGFGYLSKLLFKYYNKKVYVLIDEYDAFANNFIFKSSRDSEKITNLINTAYRHLLVSNPCVRGAFLAGVLDVSGNGLIGLGDDARYYNFLKNHTLSKYFGFTGPEVMQVIDRIVTRINERGKLRSEIYTNYRGYKAVGLDLTLYHPGLIVKYFATRVPDILWCGPEYLTRTIQVFKKERLLNETIRLVQGENITIDTSTPLTEDDLVQLNKLHDVSTARDVSDEYLNAYFYMLLQLGYLSPEEDCSPDDTIVRVASLEKEQRLADSLREFVTYHFIKNEEAAWEAGRVFKKISPLNAKGRSFRNLAKYLHHTLEDVGYGLTSPKALRDFLFVLFRYDNVKVYVDTKVPGLAPADILLVNKKNVNFIMKLGFTELFFKDERYYAAKDTVRRMVREGYADILDPEARKMVVLIAISYCLGDRVLTLAYSKFLKSTDSLNRTFGVKEERYTNYYDGTYHSSLISI